MSDLEELGRAAREPMRHPAPPRYAGTPPPVLIVRILCAVLTLAAGVYFIYERWIMGTAIDGLVLAAAFVGAAGYLATHAKRFF